MSTLVTLAPATPSSRVVSSSGTATLTASSGGRSRNSTSRARSSTPGSPPRSQIGTAWLSNAEIASRLYLSEATIKSHITPSLARLGLRDRVQIAVYAFSYGGWVAMNQAIRAPGRVASVTLLDPPGSPGSMPASGGGCPSAAWPP
jgi:pimeloyl-ACP methyl ester carboxylesterase